MAWWRNRRSKVSITDTDRHELAEFQKAVEAQQVEARSLLTDARVIGEKCRESRRRNHYRLVLDSIFEGGSS